MAPYIARVLSHPRNWSIHTAALLFRSRLESSRTRTVERSTLQLQALIDQMPTSDSTLSERLQYFHSILLPNRWKLEKELALRFASLGVVKSALEIFQRLEMWEEVVNCWRSMGRPDQGIAIIRDLLEGRKAEADEVLSRGKTFQNSGDTFRTRLEKQSYGVFSVTLNQNKLNSIMSGRGRSQTSPLVVPCAHWADIILRGATMSKRSHARNKL